MYAARLWNVLLQHVPGTFLLRFSTSRPGQLTISWVNQGGRRKHTALLNAGERGFECDTEQKAQIFPTVKDVITGFGEFFTQPCAAPPRAYLKFPDIVNEHFEFLMGGGKLAPDHGGDKESRYDVAIVGTDDERDDCIDVSGVEADENSIYAVAENPDDSYT